jgi:hypothetical protein
MSQGNWTPVYSICPDTGLRVCKIFNYLLAREDGLVKNINPKGKYANPNWNDGCNRGSGYRAIAIKKTMYNIHRLIAMSFLENFDASLRVDHIDGNKRNNSIKNLRMACIRQNAQNQKRHREGRLVGASYNATNGKWRSLVGHQSKIIHLGYFDTEILAHESYKKALFCIENGLPIEETEFKKKRSNHLKGATFNKNAKRWRAQITINGKTNHLGYFSSQQEAHEAYLKALEEQK